MWHRKGRQPRVPTPGKNRKLYVFGAIDYKSGRCFFHVQETNNPWGCRQVVDQLVRWARRIRTPVVLVWDNARTHSAKRLQAYLEQPKIRRWLKVFPLSTYSPDLNDIERLWKYLKQTGVANYLFRNFQQFKHHLLKLLANVNKDPKKITGIVFKVSKCANRSRRMRTNFVSST
jgi:transposase